MFCFLIKFQAEKSGGYSESQKEFYGEIGDGFHRASEEIMKYKINHVCYNRDN